MTTPASPDPAMIMASRWLSSISGNEAKAQQGVAAKKSSTKPTLPTLPVELWLEIVQYATFVPDILEPDIYHQTARLDPYWSNGHYSPMLDALCTKRALALVCKTWWGLCTPILYQSIILTSTRCSELLAVTLIKSRDQSSASDGTSNPSLGSFTVRLDIRDQRWRSDRSNALHSIIGCLPNLSVLTSPSIGWAPSREFECFMDHVLSVSLPLRVIDWRRAMRPQDLEQLLKNSPHLQMLRCFDIPLSHPATSTGEVLTASPVGDTSVMSNITTLDIYNSFDHQGFCSHFTFPLLRELSCNLGIQTTTAAIAQELFFKRYGHNLTSLHLQHYVSSPSNETRDLLWIQEHCPGLRNLSISLTGWNQMPVDPINIPAIVVLGLRCAIDGLGIRQYAPLFGFLKSLNETSSTLRAVQFLDPANVSNMCSFEGGRKLLKDFIKLSRFRLEDHAGRSLEVYL
ncbi:hypothetical protein PAXRUDRAFT_835196 [Paxillus rubicundulus Ve08.2h10]|uniref:F-box domain-containing protein n=1 Tax=Paxillus rubicundulus Ve08.2h10 TaxID=930991 RepID=A0A0D0C0N2_9AGAM|nr:hypothetical protein PAXRUDRAFT_835196 [Paxillus rubicundulus Ve08.2h10]